MLKDPSFTGWMLKTTAEDEELIRNRVAKVLARNPINLPSIDWRSLVTSAASDQLSLTMLEVIREWAPHGSHALNERLLRVIGDFTQGIPQTDDITLLVVEKSQ